MLGQYLAKDTAIIRGDGKVASLVKLPFVHARPTRVHFAALDRTAHHKHAVRVAMIGPTVAVLARSATEFGHADEHDVVHPSAHILMKRRNSLAQIAQ